MKLIHVAAVSLSLMLVPFCSWADEVEDSIKEGQGFYKEGNLNAALNSFNYTAQLIRQKVSNECLSSRLIDEKRVETGKGGE